MFKIIEPVLENLSQQKLKVKMPVEGETERVKFSYLEAFGRNLSGIAPWLELNFKNIDLDQQEKNDLEKYNVLARKSIKNAVDPESADHAL